MPPPKSNVNKNSQGRHKKFGTTAAAERESNAVRVRTSKPISNIHKTAKQTDSITTGDDKTKAASHQVPVGPKSPQNSKLDDGGVWTDLLDPFAELQTKSLESVADIPKPVVKVKPLLSAPFKRPSPGRNRSPVQSPSSSRSKSPMLSPSSARSQSPDRRLSSPLTIGSNVRWLLNAFENNCKCHIWLSLDFLSNPASFELRDFVCTCGLSDFVPLSMSPTATSTMVQPDEVDDYGARRIIRPRATRNIVVQPGEEIGDQSESIRTGTFTVQRGKEKDWSVARSKLAPSIASTPYRISLADDLKGQGPEAQKKKKYAGRENTLEHKFGFTISEAEIAEAHANIIKQLSSTGPAKVSSDSGFEANTAAAARALHAFHAFKGKGLGVDPTAEAGKSLWQGKYVFDRQPVGRPKTTTLQKHLIQGKVQNRPTSPYVPSKLTQLEIDDDIDIIDPGVPPSLEATTPLQMLPSKDEWTFSTKLNGGFTFDSVVHGAEQRERVKTVYEKAKKMRENVPSPSRLVVSASLNSLNLKNQHGRSAIQGLMVDTGFDPNSDEREQRLRMNQISLEEQRQRLRSREDPGSPLDAFAFSFPSNGILSAPLDGRALSPMGGSFSFELHAGNVENLYLTDETGGKDPLYRIMKEENDWSSEVPRINVGSRPMSGNKGSKSKKGASGTGGLKDKVANKPAKCTIRGSELRTLHTFAQPTPEMWVTGRVVYLLLFIFHDLMISHGAPSVNEEMMSATRSIDKFLGAPSKHNSSRKATPLVQTQATSHMHSHAPAQGEPVDETEQLLFEEEAAFALELERERLLSDEAEEAAQLISKMRATIQQTRIGIAKGTVVEGVLPVSYALMHSNGFKLQNYTSLEDEEEMSKPSEIIAGSRPQTGKSDLTDPTSPKKVVRVLSDEEYLVMLLQKVNMGPFWNVIHDQQHTANISDADAALRLFSWPLLQSLLKRGNEMAMALDQVENGMNHAMEVKNKIISHAVASASDPSIKLKSKDDADKENLFYAAFPPTLLPVLRAAVRKRVFHPAHLQNASPVAAKLCAWARRIIAGIFKAKVREMNLNLPKPVVSAQDGHGHRPGSRTPMKGRTPFSRKRLPPLNHPFPLSTSISRVPTAAVPTTSLLFSELGDAMSGTDSSISSKIFASPFKSSKSVLSDSFTFPVPELSSGLVGGGVGPQSYTAAGRLPTRKDPGAPTLTVVAAAFSACEVKKFWRTVAVQALGRVAGPGGKRVAMLGHGSRPDDTDHGSKRFVSPLASATEAILMPVQTAKEVYVGAGPCKDVYDDVLVSGLALVRPFDRLDILVPAVVAEEDERSGDMVSFGKMLAYHEEHIRVSSNSPSHRVLSIHKAMTETCEPVRERAMSSNVSLASSQSPSQASDKIAYAHATFRSDLFPSNTHEVIDGALESANSTTRSRPGTVLDELTKMTSYDVVDVLHYAIVKEVTADIVVVGAPGRDYVPPADPVEDDTVSKSRSLEDSAQSIERILAVLRSRGAPMALMIAGQHVPRTKVIQVESKINSALSRLESQEPSNFVVCITDSPASRRAFQLALSLCKPCDAIYLVHVQLEAEGAEGVDLMAQASTAPSSAAASSRISSRRPDTNSSSRRRSRSPAETAALLTERYKKLGYNLHVHRSVVPLMSPSRGPSYLFARQLMAREIVRCAEKFEPTFVLMGSDEYDVAYSLDALMFPHPNLHVSMKGTRRPNIASQEQKNLNEADTSVGGGRRGSGSSIQGGGTASGLLLGAGRLEHSVDSEFELELKALAAACQTPVGSRTASPEPGSRKPSPSLSSSPLINASRAPSPGIATLTPFDFSSIQFRDAVLEDEGDVELPPVRSLVETVMVAGRKMGQSCSYVMAMCAPPHVKVEDSEVDTGDGSIESY